MEEKPAYTYMAGLSEGRKASADWVFVCQDQAEFPCHSLIVCNASRVLRDMDEAIKSEEGGRIPIPFPGDGKEALALLECLYLQERPLTMPEVSSLARLSHQWNIPGECSPCLTSHTDRRAAGNAVHEARSRIRLLSTRQCKPIAR